MSEDFKLSLVGLDRNEGIAAKKRFDAYCKNYHISSFSNLSDLNELVKLEALRESKWKEIQDLKKKAEKANLDSYSIPSTSTKSLADLNEQIDNCKDRLGIVEDKKNETFIDMWGKILEQIDLYSNSGEKGVECVMRCPYDDCGRLVRIHKDVAGWESVPHPFFHKNNTIYNPHLFKLLDEKKITAEDVATILQSHVQYIEFLFNDIYLPEKRGIKKENLTAQKGKE